MARMSHNSTYSTCLKLLKREATEHHDSRTQYCQPSNAKTKEKYYTAPSVLRLCRKELNKFNSANAKLLTRPAAARQNRQRSAA
jgi:hypothetical protein